MKNLTVAVVCVNERLIDDDVAIKAQSITPCSKGDT